MDDRAANPDKRFVRKRERSFRHRINVTAQSQRAQIFEKTGVKQRVAVVAALRGEILDLTFMKLEFPHKIDSHRESARDGEFPTKRIFAKYDVKCRLVIVHPGFPIATRH